MEKNKFYNHWEELAKFLAREYLELVGGDGDLEVVFLELRMNGWLDENDEPTDELYT